MKEVSRSHTADRAIPPIDNTPTEEVMENAKALTSHILEPLRKEFGRFSPQSWYRSEALERVICDAGFRNYCKRNSYACDEDSWKLYFSKKSHPKGEAVDIEIAHIYNDMLFDWIKENLTYDQLIREFPKKDLPMSGWVHVSYSRTNNRRESFTIS